MVAPRAATYPPEGRYNGTSPASALGGVPSMSRGNEAHTRRRPYPHHMHPYARAGLAVVGTLILTVSFGVVGLVVGLAALVAVAIVAVRDGGDDWTPPSEHKARKAAEDEERLAAWTGESDGR